MPKLRLVSVHRFKGAEEILYTLLKEREPHMNISHRRMPSFKAHARFVRSKPYKNWYFILSGPSAPAVGSIYLSKSDEIGVFIFKKYLGGGVGQEAVKQLMKKHPNVRRFLANINPRNKRSIEFFGRLHFKHIQNTYELRRGLA